LLLINKKLKLKNIYLVIAILAGTATVYGQTTMNIYQNNAPVLRIPLADIDSVTYTTSNLATLSTTTASSITGNAAISGGTITNDGGTAITARGVAFGTAPNPTVANSKANSGSGAGNFMAYLNGLSPNVLYYARAFATNSIGTSYGNEITFTTDTASSPVTTIIIPDSVLSSVYYHQTSFLYPTKLVFPNLKRVDGYVYFHQTNNIVEVDFPVLKSTGSYFYVNGNISLQKVIAPDLNSIVEYLYVRLNTALQVLDMCNLSDIYCNNQDPYFTISGNNTLIDSVQPCFNATFHGTTLTTAVVTSFSSNTAIGGGTITHACGNSFSNGVCWSTSPNPTTNNFSANATGGINFTANLTGLSPNTTYYVRAFSGNVYGNEVSFTTLP
jgi:hypothetical protein